MYDLSYGPYSPSRLDAGVCGYQFKRAYIDKDPKGRISGVNAARGSVVHEVFEEITRRYIKDNDYRMPIGEQRDLVARAVAKYPEAYSEISDILPMLTKYMEKMPEGLTEDTEIEQKLAIKYDESKNDFVECDYDDPKAYARGRADILVISDDLTSATIIDHKTQPNIDEADTFQLGFYAWVISKIHPYLQEIKTILHFSRYGVYSDPYTWTKADLLEVEDEVITRVQSIEYKTDWRPIPNKNCQYCAFISECPVMSQYVEEDPDTGTVKAKKKDIRILGDRSRAVEIAGSVNVMSQMTDKLRDELRTFIKENGAVAIPGPVIYEYRPKTEINFDKINKTQKTQIAEIFRKHGADPVNFMVFSTTSWKPFYSLRNEELKKEIEGILPIKTSTTFGGYKS